jgi:hypothetical protein
VYNTGTVKDEDQEMAEQKKKKKNEKTETKKQQPADPSNRVFKSEHREIPDTLGK